MTLPLEERDELDLLAFRYVAGEMVPEEAGVFESRLADDQVLREAVSRAVALADCLVEADSHAPCPAAAPIPKRAQLSAGWLRQESLRSRKLVGLALSLVALLLVAVGLRAWFRDARSTGPIVAWIDGANDAASALRPGDRIHPLQRAGAIRFQNGVRLSAADDAHVEVLSGTAVRLHAGRIQVDVGELGSGFAVLTESTRVVDLGTVFGVGVNPARETDVVVFQGEVELNSQVRQRVSRPVAERNLNTGEAVRVQSNGDRSRIPMVWHDAANSQWSTDAAYRGSSLITAVSDNLATDSRPKFYAIVPHGFREDAKVYVDRRYEWNGLGEAGLPQELVGADYIRTFNDDKGQENLEIVVKLAGPADVYVLLDQRYPAPDWLTADFAETEFRMGIDLGTTYGDGNEVVPPLGVTVERRLGIGPGKSVDVPVAVWKRQVRDLREIRLGPVPSESLPTRRGSMYGIVAVPTKDRVPPKDSP
jgi:hypothetical protein